MNLTVFASGDTVFANCECIHGYAFKNAAAWDNCAHLPVICANLGFSRDNCAHLSRIECLLPQNCPA